MQERASTAIVIFSRTAEEEAAVKRFHPKLCRRGNTAIAKCLIGQSISIAKQTGLPVFTCFSYLQTGHTFGEKLANALESVFEKGFQKVIALGNDCPTLTVSSLLKSIGKLEAGKLILGPCADGGVYLIGIDQAVYYRQRFIALPWEKGTLQKGWSRYSKDNDVSIAWLEVKRDLDRAADLKRALNLLPRFSLLRRQLVSIISSYRQGEFFRHSILTGLQRFPNVPLRAPPY